MSNNTFFAVILAGGKGERFWPYSTHKKPKQLLSLVGGKPMLALAVERLEKLIPPERVLVITNAELVDACCAAAPDLPRENIIGEPIGRDTAAAIALGAAIVKKREPAAAFCVLTADHIIGDLDLFRETLAQSLALASREDVLITIGINPATPSTGYGYIEAGEEANEQAGIIFYKAKRFVEKPNSETAAKYVEAGNFYWNSGMFIWSIASVQKAFAAHRPILSDLIDKLTAVADTDAFNETVAKEYEQLEKISIDYALMEKADNILMVQGAFSWDDVGSWPALERHLPKDEDGNTVLGVCEEIGSANNIVMSENRLTALIGVKDLIVVHAEGATLICPRDKAQDVKKMVHLLREKGNYDGVL